MKSLLGSGRRMRGASRSPTLDRESTSGSQRIQAGLSCVFPGHRHERALLRDELWTRERLLREGAHHRAHAGREAATQVIAVWQLGCRGCRFLRVRRPIAHPEKVGCGVVDGEGGLLQRPYAGVDLELRVAEEG